jgi:ATP-dependent helicase HrpB
MVGGGGVRLAAESIVWDWEFFVALDARQDERSSSKEALVRIASGIDPKWLEDLFPNSIRREKSAVYDEQRKRIIGLSRVWYRDLLLSEDKESTVDLQTAGAALGAALRSRAAEMFAADEDASQMLARIALLRRSMPEQPWPAFDEAMLGDLVSEAASGKRTLEEALRQPLAQMIRNRLHYPLDRMLDEHAPESIEVPTGNRIKVTYSAVQAPVLAVRLQELFGLTDTPRVAGGRVAVVLHLLGPNYRPVQITEDLRNFWATTYFQVRKDLRARYPKHSWPDDPMTATPQAKGRSRK